MKKIHIKAYAKINLALDVVDKRTDGYHNIRTVMQTLKLYDRLYIAQKRAPGIVIRTNLPYLPTNENNLVYKASKLFMDTKAYIDGTTSADSPESNTGLYIELDKRIPVSAGLGGGSANAAATLIGLNRLFPCFSHEQLIKLAASVGADVPYCLQGGTALAEGIGEILTPLKPLPFCYCLLVKPDISVSTKYVYEKLDLSKTFSHPNIDGMVNAVNSSDINKVFTLTGNLLETVTEELHPEIKDIKQKMLDAGASAALMSGSGPTVFGLFTKLSVGENAYYKFKSSPYGRYTYLTNFVNF